VSDVTREKRIDQELVDRFGITEFAAVPLMVKDEAVGLVIVDNHLTKKNITRDDLRFLQLLLNQAGIAIENSMLYSRIEDANRDFREVQQRLIQGEKLAAIGEMAASIAHELKGPLVSIGGFARRLEQRAAPDSTEWKYAYTIAREVDRLEKMLTDTLFFSKKATITCSPCNINAIISESMAILAGSFEERNIKVKLRSHPGVGTFYGDFLQLKQVFINLFANASEAMKNGGTLYVTVAPARLDGADALYVKILDTGGGIPLEILNNIFNPFFTTKESGTGLGLPISHRIVANHGGKILVYNRIGVGAQFKVILPIHPKTPRA
jgi:signal transduction histidine kinase